MSVYNDTNTDSGQWAVSTDTAMGVISGDCCGMVRYQTVMAIGQIHFLLLALTEKTAKKFHIN